MPRANRSEDPSHADPTTIHGRRWLLGAAASVAGTRLVRAQAVPGVDALAASLRQQQAGVLSVGYLSHLLRNLSSRAHSHWRYDVIRFQHGDAYVQPLGGVQRP